MLLSGRPKTWNKNIRTAFKIYFRSDHYRFWNAEPSLPAVLVTDSTNFRGYMQQCYHEECDDISHVTSEMMTFLGQTADSLVEVATNMTSEKCQMKRTGKVMWSCCSSRRPYIKLNGISQSQAGVCVKLFQRLSEVDNSSPGLNAEHFLSVFLGFQIFCMPPCLVLQNLM